MKKKFFLISLACFLCWTFCSSTTFAQLLLEEGKVSRSLKSGETVMGKVKINNTSDREIAVKAYWQDFVYTPPFEGNKKFLAAGTTPYSCASWVNFFPQSFTLKPYEKKEISYNIKFPLEPQGGYYGVLFFEDNVGQKNTATGINVVARLGCLFFLETAGSLKEAKVLDIAASQNKISGEIYNKSQIILIPQGIFYMMNSEGIVFDRGEVGALYLPPDQGAPFFIEVSDKVPQGAYTVVLTFDLGDGESLVEEIDFEKKANSSIQILQVRD
ncbi:MAG: hypothetical protein WCX16_04310 [Candidatus Omnitrophota bacterium]|jgi:hypothetical protein